MAEKVIEETVRQHGPHNIGAETLAATYETTLTRRQRLDDRVTHTAGPLAEFTTGLALTAALRQGRWSR